MPKRVTLAMLPKEPRSTASVPSPVVDQEETTSTIFRLKRADLRRLRGFALDNHTTLQAVIVDALNRHLALFNLEPLSPLNGDDK